MIYTKVNNTPEKSLNSKKNINLNINGLKKQISLFFGRQKFNLQRKFHNTNLLQIFEITKSEQQVAFLQPTQAMGWFPAPIL
jgi:hypothetical protein